MSDLQNLKSILGLSGAQRAFLLQLSPSLLNHVEKGRRSLNALSMAFLEEASRMLFSMPRFQWPDSQTLSEPEMAKALKLFNKAKADVENMRSEIQAMKTRLQRAHDKKSFAATLALEPELAGRKHFTFCQNLIAEADSEIALLPALLFLEKEAELKALESKLAFWKKRLNS